ncbi:RT0821/Lpp0805 family surface protein [Cocleimonas flava]|uniref:Surface antigen n=2 Tax=Thiotrichaceae TaxID=135617 RepID=A0A4R1F2G5_9GAMM|nr:surface antigen [Cocleimonas flava]
MKKYLDITMKKTFLMTSVLVASIAAAGCTGNGAPNEQAGIIIGSVLGGVAGNQIGKGHGRTVATIVGTLVGSQIGGSIGRSMDDTDRLKIAHSLETVRTGVPTTWNNPDTHNHYSVVPTRTYTVNSAQPCREYTVDAIIGGKKEKIYGRACRQADGSWKVQG